MDNDTTNTIINAIDALVGLQKVYQVDNDSKIPLIAVPQDYRLESLEKFERLLPAPQRIKETVLLRDSTSFLSYYNRFKDDSTTIIFVDEVTQKVTAIFDYHDKGKPNWGEHKAEMRLEFDTDYNELKSISNQRVAQEKFAEVIDSITHVFVEPIGVEMLELAQKLVAVKTTEYAYGTKLKNGATEIIYKENISAKGGPTGTIVIPDSVRVKMPIYRYGPVEEIEFKIQFRIPSDKNSDGGLTFMLKNARLSDHERQSFVHVVKDMQKAFKSPLFHIGG